MNETRRKIAWPTWLTGQTLAFIGTVIAFAALVQNGFSNVDANMRALRAEMGTLRTELQAEMEALRTDLQGDMADLRDELRADMAHLRTELRADMADLRTELRADMADLRDELRAEIKELRVETHQGLGKLDDRLRTVEHDVAVIKTRQAGVEEHADVHGTLQSPGTS